MLLDNWLSNVFCLTGFLLPHDICVRHCIPVSTLEYSSSCSDVYRHNTTCEHSIGLTISYYLLLVLYYLGLCWRDANSLLCRTYRMLTIQWYQNVQYCSSSFFTWIKIWVALVKSRISYFIADSGYLIMFAHNSVWGFYHVLYVSSRLTLTLESIWMRNIYVKLFQNL